MWYPEVPKLPFEDILQPNLQVTNRRCDLDLHVHVIEQDLITINL